MNKVSILIYKMDLTQYARGQALTSTDSSISLRPPLMSIEENSTSPMLIDSSDRISGDQFNFTCDLGSAVNRVRYVVLRSIMVPKISNCHLGNNSFSIKHQAIITGPINIPVGFYNTTTISNALTQVINAAFVSSGVVDTVTTSFDSLTRSFSISSVGGLNFFIISDDGLNLITYGKHFIPFASEPSANVPSSPIVYSSTASMLPTRYFILQSRSLFQWQYGRSIISSTDVQVSNAFAIIDLANMYTGDDFSISIPYTGIYTSINVDGDRMSSLNHTNILNRFIDISIKDGWKRDVSTFYALPSPRPESPLGLVLNFKVTF